MDIRRVKGGGTRLVVFVVLLVVAVVIGLTVPVPELDEIRSTVRDAGAWGVLAFVVGYAALTLTPTPKSVLSVVAGLLWGLVAGAAIVYAGALIGAVTAFGLARGLGRDGISRLLGPRSARLDSAVREHGLPTLIVLRLIPVVPFTLINYGAGLSGVRFGTFLLSTAVGIIPGTIAFTALGASGAEPGWPLYLALGGLAVLTVVGALLARHRRSAMTNATNAEPHAPVADRDDRHA